MEIRTDLALESAELYREMGGKEEIPGVLAEEEEIEGIRITRVRIESPEGEEALGKKMGQYVTMELPPLLECEPKLLQSAGKQLAAELSKMIKSPKLTLVAGLGNREITPDSLGPEVIPRLIVTRHLFEEMPRLTGNLASVCALSPGVLGITGIETSEIIKGVCQRVKPDLIVVVDALASRKTERVSTTIQIADTGISPGSGVGNKRKAISLETMGVPVIAIGVPMVVDAATIASATIDLVVDTLAKEAGGELYQMMQALSHADKRTLIYEALPKEIGGMMVTPKEIDLLSEKVAHILADGINRALHADITEEEIESLVG